MCRTAARGGTGGIDARVITGTEYASGEGHAWNIVCLDGLYYNLDATWDATIYASRQEYYYFLETTESFNEHVRNPEYSSAEFNADYPGATEGYAWAYIYHVMEFSYTTATCVEDGVDNGGVSFTKTSIEPNNYGWWRVAGGKVDFSCNSVEQNDYGWWYVFGGQVQFGYTGVANYANAYGWWYIRNGQVDFTYTGLASNSYGTWYLNGGKVAFGFSGTYGGRTIRGGKAV